MRALWAGAGLAVGFLLPSTAQTVEVWQETFVQTVQVEVQPDLWAPEPLDMDAEQHAQCMIDLLNHLGLEVTVQNLFVTGDYADLVYGGPCEMLP